MQRVPKSYASANGMNHQYDACYYVIELEAGEVKEGALTVEIKALQNVHVFISGGKDKDSLDQNYRGGKAITSPLDEQDEPHRHSVAQDSKLFVFVFPDENKTDTSIEFEYVGAGSSYAWYEQWYYANFTGTEERE